MGFRMQFPDSRSSRNTAGNSGDDDGEHQASRKRVSGTQTVTTPRFWM
jgi:hypothetical protein